MKTNNVSLAPLIQSFFSDRLLAQRQASPHTIASYRDTFRLLLQFAQDRIKIPPSHLTLQQLDAPIIGAFLDHLEKNRGNSVPTRNVRLAALHSFFQYASFQEPSLLAHIQRVLAIPAKRYDRTIIDFLIRPEIEALLSAPNPSTWAGRRDHALFRLALQTGLRLSELIHLRCEDVVLGTGAHVRCHGKGRKERCTPLIQQTASTLMNWIKERRGSPSDILFPNARGGSFSPDGIQYLLAKYVRTARQTCPSLKTKRVTPHVLRHTCAMELLQAGVDISVIALWLGHESIETTQIYLHSNPAIKEKILSKLSLPHVKAGRFKPEDKLLHFLQAL